jgi:hypothetical protein
LDSNAVVVHIDAASDTGRPGTLRPGLMGSWSDSLVPVTSDVESLKSKSFWRLHFGTGTDIPGGNSLVKPANFEADFKIWLNTVLNPRIKSYQDSGHLTVIFLTKVPKWLSFPYSVVLIELTLN